MAIGTGIGAFAVIYYYGPDVGQIVGGRNGVRMPGL